MCEFCGTRNEVDIIPEEIPSKSDTTFIISPAPVSAVGGATGGSMSVEDSLVIFCIDISGSMCVTTEVLCDGVNKLQNLYYHICSLFKP